MSTKTMLNPSQRMKLLEIARKTLELSLAGSAIDLEVPVEEVLLEKGFGVFVSLHRGKDLRGCIGCFESATPLWHTVAEFAVASSRDSRFVLRPVTLQELADIQIEISVLSPVERVQKYDQAILGQHGIVVEKGSHKGVLLPQVAADTGWSLEEFWSYCAEHKAGLRADSYLDPTVNLFVFSAEVFGEDHAVHERANS
jgi:AmmeMemoRadiSam system protein A